MTPFARGQPFADIVTVETLPTMTLLFPRLGLALNYVTTYNQITSFGLILRRS